MTSMDAGWSLLLDQPYWVALVVIVTSYFVYQRTKQQQRRRSWSFTSTGMVLNCFPPAAKVSETIYQCCHLL